MKLFTARGAEVQAQACGQRSRDFLRRWSVAVMRTPRVENNRISGTVW